jgi:signal peptidase II
MSEYLQTEAGSKSKVSLIALGIGLCILLIDQLSKWFVSAHVPSIDSALYWYPYGGIPVFKDWVGIEFSINYMTNTGAAWGAFSDYQLPLILLRIFLIIGLCVYFFSYNVSTSRLWQISLALIIAGAIGNVLDFFIYGHVIDMLHFVLRGYDFPIFNIADSAITTGVVSLFILSWLQPPSK